MYDGVYFVKIVKTVNYFCKKATSLTGLDMTMMLMTFDVFNNIEAEQILHISKILTLDFEQVLDHMSYSKNIWKYLFCK